MVQIIKPKKDRLALCCPGNSFSKDFLISWTKVVMGLAYEGYECMMNVDYTPNIYAIRNQLLGGYWKRGPKQAPFQGQNYDYVVMFDSDQIITASDILNLIDMKKDIAAGWCLVKSRARANVCLSMDKDFREKEGRWPLMEPEEVMKRNQFTCDFTGFALMVIKRGVFESITYPWFEPIRTYEDTEHGQVETFMPEDVSFCKKVKEAGYKIWINSKVRVGHEKTYAI